MQRRQPQAYSVNVFISRFPTNGAVLKDTFVHYVHVDGRNEDIVRWFLAILRRMRMTELVLIVPIATKDLQDQLFDVLKCRRLSLSAVVRGYC